MKHKVSFRPAFDDMVNGCAHTPKDDHGRSSVVVSFEAKADNRAAVLEVFSGWYLPETIEKGRNIHDQPIEWVKLSRLTAVIDLHSPTPQFEGHESHTSECQITTGPCFFDSAFSAGDGVFELLIREGEGPFWEALEGWIPDELSGGPST